MRLTRSYSEAHYEELVEGYREAYVARVKASLENVEVGRITRYGNAQDLIDELGLER